MTKAGPKAVPKRPSVREEQRQLTRTRITAAARKVFAGSDYITASIDEIAAAAGIGRATFYLHFQSKEEVLRNVLAEDLERQDDLFQLLANNPSPMREDLARWVARFFAGFRSRRDSVRLFSFMEGLDPSYVLMFSARRDAYIELLGKTLPAFRLPPAGPAREVRRVEIHMLFYQISQLAFDLAFPGATLNREAALEAATDALERFIGEGQRPAS